LAAKQLVALHPRPSRTFAQATLATVRGKRVVAWSAPDKSGDSPPGLVAPPQGADQSTAELSGIPRARVQVGDFPEVGDRYQPRELDAQVQRLWQDGGDRRIWIGGGPGFGKSYTARKVMQDARSNQSENRDEVLIWVDSADPASVARELAGAAGRMPGMKPAAWMGETAGAAVVARELLQHLATSDVRWLIVFDNADADALITQRWIPPGTNPNGRVLITTTSKSSLIAGQGRHVVADLFTSEEAAEFLTARLPHAQEAERVSLSIKLGRYPLALSIAASTIVANSMEIKDWIVDFDTLPIDDAADSPDSDGYPELISATWRIALEKASEGLPDGVVERAAIVAALQDPDGHPTWLWETETVTRWVAGGTTLARRHLGKPVVLQRLDDYRIVELQDNSWKNGRLAIHQLAARAVCELAADEVLAEIAAILADEWLLQLSEKWSVTRMLDIRRGVQPLSVLVDLPTLTRHTVAALLGYTAPPDRAVLAWIKEAGEFVAPYLRQGGAIGQADLAVLVASLGEDEEQLGRLGEALAKYADSAQIFHQVIADASVNGDLRALCLKGLGEVQEKLGHHDQSQESFRQASLLYEQLTATESGIRELGAQLVALADMYDKLGNTERARATRERWDELLNTTPPSIPIEGDVGATFYAAESWALQGRHLGALGRPVEAKDRLARAVEAYRQCEFPSLAEGLVGEIAQLHIETGHRAEAERCLTSLTMGARTDKNDLVLLASLQKRSGQLNEAERNLSRAAAMYLTAMPGKSVAEITKGDWMEDTGLRRVFFDYSQSRLRRLFLKAVSRNRWSDAAGLATGSLDVAQKRAEANPGEHEAEIAQAHSELATSYLHLNQGGPAEAHSAGAVSIWQLLSDLDDANRDLKARLARALAQQGMIHFNFSRPEDAIGPLTSAVDAFDQLSKTNLGSVARDLAGALAILGDAYGQLGRADEAVDCFTRHVTLRETVANASPSNRMAQNEIADAWRDLGKALARFAREEDAVKPLLQNLELCRALADDQNPHDGKTAMRAAEAQVLLGLVYLKLDRHADALKLLSQAVSELQDLANQDFDDVETQENHANARSMYGIALFQAEHLADAAEQLRLSTNVYEMLLGLNSGKYKSQLIPLLEMYAEVLRRLDRPGEADIADTRAAALAQQMDDEGSTNEG